MTISSTTRVAGPFIGAGTTATFPFTFKVFEATDLYVVTLNVATGQLTPLALTADYTAALNADQDTDPGGSITLTAGNLAIGLNLVITTDIAQLQGLDLANGGAFYPDVINAALDLLTVLIQQLQTQASRSLQIPVTDSASMELPPAAQRAGMLLMFDANGNLSLVPMAPGSGVPGAQAATGLVNAINKNFTFAAAPGVTPAPVVFAGGIFQSPGTDYGVPTSIGGGLWQIAFTKAPIQGPITILQFA